MSSKMKRIIQLWAEIQISLFTKWKVHWPFPDLKRFYCFLTLLAMSILCLVQLSTCSMILLLLLLLLLIMITTDLYSAFTMWMCSNALYKQVQSWSLRDLDRSEIFSILNNAFSRWDRPHNIGITTLLFTINVCGFF